MPGPFASAYPEAVPRVSFLLSAIAVAIAQPAASAATASGASPEGGTVVLVELTLTANNGLHAHLDSSDDGTVTLELRREGQTATYEVPGEVTEAGLKHASGDSV